MTFDRITSRRLVRSKTQNLETKDKKWNRRKRLLARFLCEVVCYRPPLKIDRYVGNIERPYFLWISSVQVINAKILEILPEIWLTCLQLTTKPNDNIQLDSIQHFLYILLHIFFLTFSNDRISFYSYIISATHQHHYNNHDICFIYCRYL